MTISNNRPTIRVKEQVPSAGKGSYYRWQGFEDARTGLGYHRDYDSWKQQYQENYERGRQLFIVSHLYLGGTSANILHNRVPKWNKNMLSSTYYRKNYGRSWKEIVPADLTLPAFLNMTNWARAQGTVCA